VSPRSHVTLSTFTDRLRQSAEELLRKRAEDGLIEKPESLSDGETEIVIWRQADLEEAYADVLNTMIFGSPLPAAFQTESEIA